MSKCFGYKKCFESVNKAKKCIKAGSEGARMRVYFCKDCKAYHTTRQKNNRSAKWN